MRIPKGILKIGKCAVPDADIAPMSTVRIMRVAGDRCLAEVTDGRSAVRVAFMEPASSHLFGFGIDDNPVEGVEQLVPGDVAVKSDQAIPKDPGYAVLDEKPPTNQIAVVVPGASQQQRWDAAMVSGEFPDVGGVLRSYQPVDVAKGGLPVPCAVVAIDPDLLIGALKALAEATAGISYSPVLMEVPLRRGEPVQFRRGRYKADGVEGIAILMPMSEDGNRRRVELADGVPDAEPQPTLPGVEADAGEAESPEPTTKAGKRRRKADAQPIPGAAEAETGERRNVTTADGRKITAGEMMAEIGQTFSRGR